MATQAMAQAELDREDAGYLTALKAHDQAQLDWLAAQQEREPYTGYHKESELMKLPGFRGARGVPLAPGKMRNDTSVLTTMDPRDVAKLTVPLMSGEDVRMALYKKNVQDKYDLLKDVKPPVVEQKKASKSFLQTLMVNPMSRKTTNNKGGLKLVNDILQQNDRIRKQDFELEEAALAVEKAATQRQEAAFFLANNVTERFYDGRASKNEQGIAIAELQNYQEWIQQSRTFDRKAKKEQKEITERLLQQELLKAATGKSSAARETGTMSARSRLTASSVQESANEDLVGLDQ
eukprot:CAMPEP_0180255266 /NCGR_PEP_ID=MMETSP0987-20121128/40632_1 /TAXON_ID=697907 /ORGANISM="non described non described, Strain CCMP2293" /LENGTH=291 /DNA_ID=CAMNT_0022224369 /DNA_START=1 /DNA_END=872 /DNA_ORIENTATION=+